MRAGLGMRQVYRSTRRAGRLLALAALAALVSATNSSAPVARHTPRHLAQHHVVHAELREARVNLPRQRFLNAAEQARVKAAFEAAARHEWATASRLAAGSA